MSNPGTLAIKPFDPMLHDIDLPLSAALYPIGFRVNLHSNCRDVLDAAQESWGMYGGPEFDVPPLEIRVVVEPGGVLACSPAFRIQGQLFSAVSDRHNFATYDSRSMSGFCFVSQETAAHHLALRVHFVEAMVYMLLAQRYVAPMHAACVARNGRGVLLHGVSSAGKSSLAYASARAGWTYVADDCTWLLPGSDDRTAIGQCHVARFREDAPALFPELEGYAARAHPNGKVSIEAPLADFPGIRTARRCPIECMALLDRRPGPPGAWKIPAEEIVERLLADVPSYGEEVNAMYATTIGRLAGVAAYRLRYETLDDAIRLLNEMVW